MLHFAPGNVDMTIGPETGSTAPITFDRNLTFYVRFRGPRFPVWLSDSLGGACS
jgi:hypothetical protein